MQNNRKPDFWDELFRPLLEQPSIPVQSKPTAPISHLRPHYTDDRFKSAQTVYLAKGYKLTGETVKGAAYNYSDRYRQWSSVESWDKAIHAAKAQFPETNCAAHIEAFLRAIHDDPELKLVHIMAGFNVSNGYDYQVYGFIPGKKEA